MVSVLRPVSQLSTTSTANPPRSVTQQAALGLFRNLVAAGVLRETTGRQARRALIPGVAERGIPAFPFLGFAQREW